MSLTPFTSSDLNLADNEATLNVGDLGRAYNVPFGPVRLSELQMQTDVLFRILAMKRTIPVDDTHFKFFEKRPYLHKRYGYVTAFKTYAGSGNAPVSGYTADDDLVGGGLTPQTQGSYMALELKADYLSDGLIQNIYGQSNNAITVGDTGTRPKFFLTNQVIKVNTKSATGDLVADDFFTLRIMDVQSSGEATYVAGVVVKSLGNAANKYLCSWPGGTVISSTYNLPFSHTDSDTKTMLESAKTYVVTNAYRSGTGLPGFIQAKKHSSRTGLTQIIKHAIGMDNSAKATVTRFDKDPFAEYEADTFLDHKWDISQAMYFEDQYEEDDGTRHTQGMIPWCLSYCNTFALDKTKTQDQFLNDISTFTDPKYNGRLGRYLFSVTTEYYNWLHQLAGYALNNLKLGRDTTGAIYTHDFVKDGAKSLFGAQIFAFGTQFGTMNVLEDVHLNGTQVKMVAIPLDGLLYRPLVGNEDRNTRIYKEVVSLNKGGIDVTVDLILTEFGMEYSMPERWAIWL